MRSTRLLRAAAVAAALLTSHPLAAVAGPAPLAPPSAADLVPSLATSATGLRPEVLRAALAAVTTAWERGRIARTDRLTVIDYSLPSTEKRLWVLDLRHQTVLFHELVAHGKHSGDNLATQFSNALNSLQTSLGLFVTDDTYVGQNGYSLRLDGLDPGVNDRARERAIVVHGAPYVNDGIARTLGRLGRSWGCPAVPLGVARRLIDDIKGGSAVFAYHPRLAPAATTSTH